MIVDTLSKDRMEKVKWVGPHTALKVVSQGFPEGGYRRCRKCNKSMSATIEQIVVCVENGLPPCKICGSRTELLTPEEHERTLPKLP